MKYTPTKAKIKKKYLKKKNPQRNSSKFCFVLIFLTYFLFSFYRISHEHFSCHLSDLIDFEFKPVVGSVSKNKELLNTITGTKGRLIRTCQV